MQHTLEIKRAYRLRFFSGIVLLLLIGRLQLKAQTPLNRSIWKSVTLNAVPSYKVVSRDSALGLVYEGTPYLGHRQEVFAYYATPGTVYGNPALDKNLPAVILVHGGGGRAFKQWAIQWAKKGYAALAMDLRGNGPEGKHLPNGFTEPGNQTPYFDLSLPLDGQWMYQAVADVLLANNLISSLKEVDPTRTAITGISWGAVITCIVAALDPRYKAAVPVYGCGFLGSSGRMKAQLSALSRRDKNTWLTQYDPSGYLLAVKIPMLFLNDANDPYFELPSYMKSYDLVNSEKKLCIKINLKHSHHAGWSNEEIYHFINHQLRGTPALPEIKRVTVAGKLVICQAKDPVSVKDVMLNYSTAASNTGTRTWTSVLLKPDTKNQYRAKLPDEAAWWFFSVENKKGWLTCTPVRFAGL